MTTDIINGFSGLDQSSQKAAIRALIAIEPSKAEAVANTALEQMTREQRKASVESLVPQESKHRMCVSGLAAVALVLVATIITWAFKNSPLGSQMILLVAAFGSGVVGGLFGNLNKES